MCNLLPVLVTNVQMHICILYFVLIPHSFCVLFFRMLSELSEWFWQERLWFPEGLGWADLEDRDGRVYAKARDLWVALPIALLFLIVRQLFERSVQLTWGYYSLSTRLLPKKGAMSKGFPSFTTKILSDHQCVNIIIHLLSETMVIIFYHILVLYYLHQGTRICDSRRVCLSDC